MGNLTIKNKYTKRSWICFIYLLVCLLGLVVAMICFRLYNPFVYFMEAFILIGVLGYLRELTRKPIATKMLDKYMATLSKEEYERVESDIRKIILGIW